MSEANPRFENEAAYVQRTIEQLRTKLLDLSNRNRLLNFRFSESSRTHVRIIDELPDQLFNRLNGEPNTTKKLTFRSLPDPHTDPLDEQSQEFLRALEIARQTDLIYVEASRELKEKDDATTEAVDQIERELKDRLRHSLEMPPRPDHGRISLAEHARLHGIDPSYDLPIQSTDNQCEKHTDSYTQTLLLPEAMDRKLSAIRDAERISQQELGLSTLFTAFGFLEWYESADSDKPLFSPLLLLPIQMDRELKQHRYQYFIQSGEGGDPVINITLRERLKRDFRIALPELDENDTPESYMQKVASAISQQRRWRVRRFAVIGHFSFARLVMYEDLDPERWLEGRLNQHSILLSLLAGQERNENPLFAEEYFIDDPEVETKVPLLITDADSSQFSAIVDVMDGKNLAIKGPPGTGKSQTITNLIAAALAANKSVLFVAEKMAALEVVAKRLTDAGLAPFCLELHSTKVQKKKVLQSLGSRLEIRPTKPPKELDEQIKQFQKLRLKLNRYVTVMNSEYSAAGWTLHDIFWHEQLARRRATETNLNEAVISLFDPSAGSISKTIFQERLDLLNRLSDLWTQCSANLASLQDHPLWGIYSPGSTYFEHERLEGSLQDWKISTETLTGLLKEFTAIFKIPFDSTLSAAETLTDILNQLPEFSDSVDANLLPNLRNEENLKIIADFLENLSRLKEAKEKLGGYALDCNALIENLSALSTDTHRLLPIVKLLGLESIAISTLGEAIHDLNEHYSSLQVDYQRLSEVAAAIGIQDPLSSSDGVHLLRAIALLKETSRDVLKGRGSQLFDEEAEPILSRARIEAIEILRLLPDFQRDLIFSWNDDPRELRDLAGILREKNGIQRIFSAQCRLAKKRYKRMSRSSKGSALKIADRFEALAELIERYRRFMADEDLLRVCNKHFRGLETPFDLLLEVHQFAVRVRSLCPGISKLHKAIRAFLLTADLETLDAVVHSASEVDPDSLSGRFAKLAIAPTLSLQEAIETFKSRIEILKEVHEFISALALKDHLLISELPQLVRHSTLAHDLLHKIRGNSEANRLLGPVFKAETTDRAALEEALRVAREIHQCRASLELQATILSPHYKTVHTELRRFASALCEGLEKFKREQKHLGSDFGLDSAQWFNATRDLIDIAARVGRCIESRESYGIWAQFQNCRQEAAFHPNINALIRMVEKGGLKHSHLNLAYQLAHFRSLIRLAMEQEKDLPQWTGAKLEIARTRLALLDKEITMLCRKKLFSQLARMQIPTGNSLGPRKSWTERSLIENEISKQTKHIPIRDLMYRASAAIRALKPCLMMSPASVAQFIRPGSAQFDLVVIDEASQMRPEDAISAIARGKQLVVVGDPQQLPPSSFFDRADEMDESEDQIDDESVLDQALSTFRPARDLRWHYRSKHQSLIAFSNRKFYDNKLIVFPAPMDASRELGVKHIHVADGLYKSQINPREAEVVIEQVSNLMRLRPKRSIGVVTLNQPQRDLLKAEFDRLFANNADLEAYRQQWEGGLEEFFVKNLENVQGDERDIIVISTAYGQETMGGPVMQRFGPINSNVGHRRLNVLFTRAKEQTLLISSLQSTDIHPSNGANLGVHILKEYLEFSQSGRLEQGTLSGRSYDSPFEMEIAELLQQRGYRVECQVGIAGYFIDLAVRHPQNHDHFMLGIECDGATYHSAKSARDRDRLRQEMLENLGWQIYRIWSTDWFGNREVQIQKLLNRLNMMTTETTNRLNAAASI